MMGESARELAWIRDRLADPLHEAPQAAVIATTLDGQVAFWNASAERLYGWREDEAVGRDILELTPADYSRDQAQRIMDALRTGRTWEGEILLRHRTGAPLRTYVLDIPVGDFDRGQGAIIGLSVLAERREALEAHASAAGTVIARRFSDT